MRATARWTMVVLVLLCTLTFAVGPAQAGNTGHQTGFDEWVGAEGGFANWEMSGARLSTSGDLVLDPNTAVEEQDPYTAGTYYGGSFYNGGIYWVGEAAGPAIPTAFDFDELISSWNALTPTGTWVEVLVRAELDGHWTKWYSLGIWASGSETVQRHSVPLQGDGHGSVAVDTLVISAQHARVTAYQLRVRLFSVDGETTPSVRYVSAAYSTTSIQDGAPSTGNPEYWNTLLTVPECSQMVYDGGYVWCSPTSTSMILSYWEGRSGPCEPGVRAAVAGVYDWVYDGTGNWPFNTAYAATYSLQGSVRRFDNMEEIEAWVAQGVPVAISFAWGWGQLTGAPLPSSSGHLAVVVGFDGQGNPIVNDPAADSDDEVQRTYLRSELEPLWLENSRGTVYLIKPVAATYDQKVWVPLVMDGAHP